MLDGSPKKDCSVTGPASRAPAGLHTDKQRLTACRIGLLPSPMASAWSPGVTSWQATSLWLSPLKLMVAPGVSLPGAEGSSGAVPTGSTVSGPRCAAACAFIAANWLSETGLRGRGMTRCANGLAVVGNWLKLTICGAPI